MSFGFGKMITHVLSIRTQRHGSIVTTQIGATSMRDAVILMGTLAKNPATQGVMVHDIGTNESTERALLAWSEPVSERA